VEPANLEERIMQTTRTYRIFDLVGRRIGIVAVGAMLLVIALGLIGPMIADTDEPNFDPAGEVFDTLERSGESLRGESTVETAMFLVEPVAGDSNVLTADAIREWHEASNRVRTNPEFSQHLVNRFDRDAGTSVPGVMSITDAVDAQLDGGIESSTDSEIVDAVAATLNAGSGMEYMRFTLSEQASTSIDVDGTKRYEAPAFTTRVVFDSASFESNSDQELWLRDMQAEFRTGAIHTDSIGVAIDGDITFEEAATQSAPFIFLAVGLIVLLVAVVHRSFWSAAVVGAGLAATTLAYYGTAALLGLKMGSLLLAFIVPIAMISFGVDFYIHGVGRVREMQVERGMGVSKAYPFGMTAVFTAMFLAVSSSVAAFLANAASGTEAIIQFGVGSAVALAWAYVLLGQLAPRVTVGLEAFVGPNPRMRAMKPVYAFGTLVMAIVGGLTVALGAVMPTIGAIAFIVFVVFFVGATALVARWRNHRAMMSGKTLVDGHSGVAHGLAPVGTFVSSLARWKMITIPIIIVVTLLGFARATDVESGFKIEDFLSSNTDFAQSIVRVSEHFPSSGEGSSLVFIEGDLANPANLALIDDLTRALSESDAEFGRNTEGDLLVGLHAGDLVRMVMAVPSAVSTIESDGPTLIDTDGDLLPDSAAGIAAIYRYAAANGVPGADGAIAVSVDDVRTVIAETDAGYATAVRIQVGSFTDGEVIVPVREAMQEAADQYESSADGVTALVSGEVIAQYVSMDSFTRSMLVSLPLAALLTFILASVMLRSIRYALVAVVPIGLVVIGVYAFMATFGYTVNVVTATIAAIAVGVGIDFSTHFTARYREELGVDGSRLEAVKRTGSGTGGALVLSALTSVLGFTVMAMAPTPIFATFGVLTAVMIVLSLAVALLVLPSLLVLVSSDIPQPADEREHSHVAAV
jgi:predicted RND superfamily exporter protein